MIIGRKSLFKIKQKSIIHAFVKLTTSKLSKSYQNIPFESEKADYRVGEVFTSSITESQSNIKYSYQSIRKRQLSMEKRQEAWTSPSQKTLKGQYICERVLIPSEFWIGKQKPRYVFGLWRVLLSWIRSLNRHLKSLRSKAQGSSHISSSASVKWAELKSSSEAAEISCLSVSLTTTFSGRYDLSFPS